MNRIVLCVVVLCMFSSLVLGVTVTDTSTSCDDKITNLQVQQAVMEQNLNKYIDMKINQSDTRTAGLYMELRKYMAEEDAKRITQYDAMLKVETNPYKYQIGTFLSTVFGCSFILMLSALKKR